ncbi:MAG: hypothetical protein AAF484_14730 [Pseudomonadota bacterium]
MGLIGPAVLIAMLGASGMSLAAEGSPPLAAAQVDDIVAVYHCDSGLAVAENLFDGRSRDEARILLAAAGRCVMKQDQDDTLYCESGTCTGTCKLRNFPLKCQCE